MTKTFTGKSEGFEVNGNTVSIEFPNSLSVKEGKLYTLVVGNNFMLYENCKAVPKTTTSLKFTDSPLILTFVGKKAGDDKLLVQSISVDDNANLETLKDVRYTFNTSIISNSGVSALIKENNTTVTQATSMTVEDGHTLVVDFGDKVNLNLGHTYSVVLPAGAVSMGSDTSKTNSEFLFNVNGV